MRDALHVSKVFCIFNVRTNVKCATKKFTLYFCTVKANKMIKPAQSDHNEQRTRKILIVNICFGHFGLLSFFFSFSIVLMSYSSENK
jgi:hypothetical protein